MKLFTYAIPFISLPILVNGNENALDCFKTDYNLYGNRADGRPFNDLDFLNDLSKYHVLSDIKFCENDEKGFRAIRLDYGIWKDGNSINTVGLSTIGN